MYLSGPALWNVHVCEAIKSGPAVRTLARWQSNAQWQHDSRCARRQITSCRFDSESWRLVAAGVGEKCHDGSLSSRHDLRGTAVKCLSLEPAECTEIGLVGRLGTTPAPELAWISLHPLTFAVRVPRLDAKRAVIVNDDSSVIALIQTLLERWELSTFPVRRGPLALPTIRARMPDLVVLDIRMEEPDTGWKILARLRSDPEICETPVIICSANLSRSDQTQDLPGVTDVFLLPIPFDIDDFFSVVAQALEMAPSPWPSRSRRSIDYREGG